MARRTICIQSPSKLSIRHNSLCIQQGSDKVAEIPLEEIWVLILDTPQISITSAALSRLIHAGVGTMTCGTDHLPNGLLLPLGAHSRHAAIVEQQLAMSLPLKKRLWQQLVVRKIENQAKVLELLGCKNLLLKQYAHAVQSGDRTNRESVAASTYFKNLIECGNRREGPYSAPLDYGYAVLRAGIGREAVAHGWLVSRGIHHESSLNAFNLVDDLIETFRPVIDLLICEKQLAGNLSSKTKAQLASIFEVLVVVDGKKVSVQHAIEHELNSLKAAVINNDASLLRLPAVIPISFAHHE